jgi:FtsH-binding integral membrane protein
MIMSSLAIGIFNVVFGIVCILTGLEIYWPFKESSKEKMKKMKPFYLVAGIGLVIWGLVNLFFLK